MSTDKPYPAWKRIDPGLYYTEFNGHRFDAMRLDNGLWAPTVDGRALKEFWPPNVEIRHRFAKLEEALRGCIEATIPAHVLTVRKGGSYCSFDVGYPKGHQCGHDRWWVGHVSKEEAEELDTDHRRPRMPLGNAQYGGLPHLVARSDGTFPAAGWCGARLVRAARRRDEWDLICRRCIYCWNANRPGAAEALPDTLLAWGPDGVGEPA